MRKWIILMLALAAIVTGCQVVPTTGDTASDAAAAQRFVPQSLPGYVVTDATSVADALTKVGASGALVSGNAPLAAAVAKIDDMIRCYQGVGAVAARVYTEANIISVVSGQVPKIGAIAVVNTTRLQRNLLQCVLNTGPSAQAAGVQPCGSSGSFTVNGENLEYVFAATDPQLCTVFQSQFNNVGR